MYKKMPKKQRFKSLTTKAPIPKKCLQFNSHDPLFTIAIKVYLQ